jgi:hypothetical protein
MSEGRAGKVARPEGVASLLALAPALPGPWSTRAASIALAPVVVTAANGDWLVEVSVHAFAQRSGTDPRKVGYGVELLMRCNQAPQSEKGRSKMRAWQRRITKQLLELGLKGEWRDAFAYFSRDLARLAQIPPAVRKLQRVRF